MASPSRAQAFAMNLSPIHILTLPSSSTLLNNLPATPNEDILGIWAGEYFEDAALTLVLVAGLADGLDSASLFGFTPKQQQRTEISLSALLECLSAPVTEVAITGIKAGCDRARAASLIDAAMQTVLSANDCTAATWKTTDDQVFFFVGWRFLEAHEKYHQVIFANPPDCIKQLPDIVDSSTVFHVTFKEIHRGPNKM